MNIKVKIVKTFNSGSKGKVLAIADAVIEDAFAIHGLKVVDGEKGFFLSMPNSHYTNKDGESKYSDVFHPINAEARKELQSAVYEEYVKTFSNTVKEDYSLAETDENGLSEML